MRLSVVATMATVLGLVAIPALAAVPQAFDASFQTKIDTPVFVFLDAFDPDFDSLTYTVTGGPSSGSLDDCSPGFCTYTPNTGFLGTDSFTFTASDGTGSSNEATVTIDVTPNQAPVASDGAVTTKVDTPVFVFLDAFDPDFDSLTYTVTGGPSSGSLDDCSSGFCTYTPNTGFIGSDSFTFTASDGDLTSNEATVTIDVQEDLPPVATDGSYQTKTGRAVEITLDATDPNFDAVTFAVVSGPAGGSLGDCTFGFCTYTPNASFSGTDTFTWTANDGTNDSNVATTSIEVLPTALRVTPLSGSLTVADLAQSLAGPGVTITNVTFTGSELGAGVFSGGSAPIGFAEGVILGSGAVADVIGPNLVDGATTSLNTAGDADLTSLAGVTTLDATILEFDLTPATGQLTFQYVFASEEYNEYVNSSFNDVFAFFVNGQNCALVEGQPVSINTVNNGNPHDSDPRSNPSYFINNDLNDGGGSVDTEMDGLTVVLTCIADVNPDVANHVKLAIADGSDSSLDSAVFLAQGSFQANSAPTANDISTTTPVNTPVGITLTGTDPEGDALTFLVVASPANGTLSGTEPNLTYTPDPGFVGIDTFTYIANDGALDSDAATVTITVEAGEANLPPVVDAGGDESGVEGSPVGLDATVSDPDGDPLTLSWSYMAGVGVDAGATCSFSDPTVEDPTITCTDDGTYAVTLSASDGTNPPVQDSATVTITNADPTVDITSPGDGSTFLVGATVNLSASLADPGANDTHTCSIDWGDGTTTDGTVTAGTCTGSHTYATIGVPTVLVTVTDDDGGTGTDEIMLIISAPGTKVTGGGWLLTPDGTRVSIGLVADGTEGQLQVRVHNSDKFHGTDVDGVIATGTTATWTGPGRWNGQDGYTYQVTVGDNGNGRSKKGSPDNFSITIYDHTATVVWTISGPLAGGNLRIH